MVMFLGDSLFDFFWIRFLFVPTYMFNGKGFIHSLPFLWAN